MIKKLLTIGIFAILLAAVIYLMFLMPRAGDSADAKAEATVQWAIQNELSGIENFEVEYLVVGAEIKPRLWEFRGMITRNASDSLTFGTIEQTCKRMNRNDECWKIVDLKLDGRDWEGQSGSSAQARLNEQPTSTPRVQSESAVETGTTTTPVETTATAQVTTPEPKPEPEAVIEIWRTSRSIVNARKGPGTNFPIVTRITPAFALTMVSKEAGWGQFEVIEPDRLQGQIIWIWLDLVSKTES